MYGAQQPQSGQLDITTAFGATQIFLHGSMAFIEIDGQPTQRPWGRQIFDLWPGMHVVRVWFPYLFSSQAGLAALQVPIYAGHATMVTYQTPLFVTSSGTMRMVGSRPAGQW